MFLQRFKSNLQDLHKQLRPLCTLLKSIELPSTAFKLFLPKNDRATLERAKKQIQRYLNVRSDMFARIHWSI